MAIGLVAVLLIAPQTTEFATKVAVLAALALVCAARPVGELILALACARAASGPRARRGCRPGRRGHVRGARRPRRHPRADERGRSRAGGERVGASRGDSRALRRRLHELDRQTALKIASDLVTGLRTESEALASGDAELAATVAGGARLAMLFERMGADTDVPDYHVERVRLTLEVGEGQAPPLVVADIAGRADGVGRRAARPEHLRGDAAPGAAGRALPHRRLARRSQLSVPHPRWACAEQRRRARKRPTGQRRATRRAQFPPRRLPLQDLRGSDGDDGRRRLLARLRR